MNKAMIDSYLRNLLGVVLALIATTTANAGVASPLDLGAGEWLTILNGVWAAAIPTVIRYLNKKDPAFGKVAEVVAAEVSLKIDQAAKAAPKRADYNPDAKDGDKDGKVQDGTIHERPAKPAAKKAPAKKPASGPKKTTK
jgi:hypothetical protein